MKKTENPQGQERADLKEYLQQFHYSKQKKKMLEARHRNLTQELRAPGPSSTNHTMPSKNTSHGDGAVSVVFRLDEVESRITAQHDEMAKAVIHVMDVLDFLPINSTERNVLELRHIDCKRWERIADEIHISRSRTFDYYNVALNKLLEYKRVRKLVGDYVKARDASKQ